MNHWTSQSAADRYASGRPYFHPFVISKISEFLSERVPFTDALDVGCGTGLSSTALKQIAKHVVGVDDSPEMLRHALPDDQLHFVKAAGEELPFDNTSFDLISLSQSFHWLDRSKFFAEARRVLRANGWIVVYDNYFSAMMRENESFHGWFKDYLVRFPTPPRPKVQFTEEDARSEGFEFVHKDMHENWPEFSTDSLIAYLMTQSNISAALDDRGESSDEIESWMRDQLAQFIPQGTTVHIAFGSPIWYLQKAA
jgi:SAM-dependent methyltransferase